jgi:hypothetical protein
MYDEGWKRRMGNTGSINQKTVETSSVRSLFTSQKGIALVMALIITLVVFLLVMSTLYVIMQGTGISGLKLAYTTACEAADGGVEIAKDAIEQTLKSPSMPVANVFDALFSACMQQAVLVNGQICTTLPPAGGHLILPGTMGPYTADVTVRRLFAKVIPGAAVKMTAGPRRGTGTIAIFFRIDVIATERVKNTTCENAAIYRHVL